MITTGSEELQSVQVANGVVRIEIVCKVCWLVFVSNIVVHVLWTVMTVMNSEFLEVVLIASL